MHTGAVHRTTSCHTHEHNDGIRDFNDTEYQDGQGGLLKDSTVDSRMN